jgi:hypothetical chaperone protein
MVENRPLPLEEMVGLFLLEMRKRAEAHFQREADAVVIGRPARYSLDPEADKFAEYRMRKAAEFAGFHNVTFVAEPLAAAYEFRKTIRSEKIILVADFGGGTSDFTIVHLNTDDMRREDVLAVDGINVAGDALDGAIMTHKVAPYFGSNVRYRVPMSDNILKMPPAIHLRLCQPAHIVHLQEPQTFNFLKNAQSWATGKEDKKCLERLFVLIEDQQIFSLFEAIERSKRGLSDSEMTTFSFMYPTLEIEESFSRIQFGQWIESSTQLINEALERTLTQANLQANDIDLVCSTGGTAKVFHLQHLLINRFGREKMQSGAFFHSVLHGLVEMAHRLAKT